MSTMSSTSYPFEAPSLVVRFCDLDASGHLNHAAILKFVEHARVLYYRDVLAMSIPEDLKLWVLADINVSYRSPAKFDEVLDIGLRIPWMKRSSAGWQFQLTSQLDNRVIANGSGVHVHVDATTGQSQELPGQWRSQIAALEGIPTREPSM